MLTILPDSSGRFDSLEDVRMRINDIDSLIMTLLQHRQEMVFHAAKFKNNEKEVRDDARVQAVLDTVAEKAKILGLDETLARNVYRVMIDRFIEMEIERHRQKSPGEKTINPE